MLRTLILRAQATDQRVVAATFDGAELGGDPLIETDERRLEILLETDHGGDGVVAGGETRRHLR